MLRRFTLSTVLLVAGCDSTTVVSGSDVVYRSEGTDYPTAAVVLSGGDIVVGALVNGTIAPADGTIGYPAVVRFGEDGFEAAVYDGDERDFYGVDGVARLGDGLAIAIGSEAGVEVYRTNLRGGSRERIARLDDARFIPQDALHAVPGGLVLAVYATEADAPHLYGLSASGDVRWTYRLPEAQDVQALSVAPDGDLLVAGPGRRGGEAIVARLSSGGAERWRTEVVGLSSPVDVAATEAGAAVLGQSADLIGVQVTRLGVDGDVVWSRRLSDEQSARPTRIALLGNGTVAAALTDDDGDFETGNVARLVLLEADGSGGATVPIGEPVESTTFVQGLLALPDGRLGVVSAVGPKRLGGYGGDDFDIEVARIDLRPQPEPQD